MTEPAGLRFSRSHEWARLEDDRVVVGISDYAQDAVGDVVFVDLPQVGAELAAGDSAAEVESTKTVSSIIAPIAGRVLAVNEALSASPETVNEDPYGSGWMFAIVPADSAQYDALMDAGAYAAYVEGIAG
jgi:glycine cleavage system H protein